MPSRCPARRGFRAGSGDTPGETPASRGGGFRTFRHRSRHPLSLRRFASYTGCVSTTEDRLQDVIRQLRASAGWGQSSDREDLAQEALVRAIRHDVAPDALPWLRTVARRIAIDRARRAQEIPSGSADEIGAFGPCPLPGPEDQAISREVVAEIERAMDALPERYREALLAYLEEERPARVAARLGLSPNATWTLLSRARQRLREHLREAGVVPSVVWLRLGRWRAQVLEGAMACGVAVTLAVASSGPAAPAAAGEPVARSESAMVAAVQAPPVPVSEEPVEPAVRVQAVAPVVEPPAPEFEVTFRKEASVCVPDEDGGFSVSGGVRFEDGPHPSVGEQVVQRLPDELRSEEADPCGT